MISKKRRKRIRAMIGNYLHKGGSDRAQYLVKVKYFAEFGENGYWYPRNLPSDPECIYLHNNVNIATDVYFCTHDVIHHMLNHCQKYVDLLGGEKYNYTTGRIEIMDNVFVGAKTVIMYGVTIGANSIVAAGSVVTKDVPPHSVVGGCPAKVICSIEDYLLKRPEIIEKGITEIK